MNDQQGQPSQQARGYMKVKTFTYPKGATQSQIDKKEDDINDFLKTMDNTKRFLISRGAINLGDTFGVQVWYIDADEFKKEPHIETL